MWCNARSGGIQFQLSLLQPLLSRATRRCCCDVWRAPAHARRLFQTVSVDIRNYSNIYPATNFDYRCFGGKQSQRKLLACKEESRDRGASEEHRKRCRFHIPVTQEITRGDTDTNNHYRQWRIPSSVTSYSAVLIFLNL